MARLDVLSDGFVDVDGGVTPGSIRVGSTVSLIRDGDLVAIVDPGMVTSRGAILDPLAALGVTVDDVTDVIISHHHPDHTINIALFPNVRIHDNWATYHHEEWVSRPAEGLQLSEGVRLIETPGHTPQDITTLVETDQGVAALTHLWGYEGAGTDRLAADHGLLDENRLRVLDIATIIVPGHGPMYTVG
ncbi:metallo-beta-lactamase [hydrothermal vent metagenome]|uniref:Metallo-beta-lactamase domain-containing protein 1 n=1 Tax=hydrothermal vent metagenome TaxID=652676 RepID=A0A3B0TJ66_9ZZZZ